MSALPLIVPLVALVVLVAAACRGGGEPGTPATLTATPAAPTTTPTTPTATPVLPTPLRTDLRLQAEDGLELAATLYGEGPVGVVLAHQRGGDRTAWEDVAQALAARGFTVLTFDFRGHGESPGGDLSDIVRDLRAAVRFLREQGVSQVFVVGVSMGGTAALALAAGEELTGVVTISSPAQFQGIDAEATIGQVTEPLLFIVAEEDQPYAGDLARLARAAGARLVTFPGDEHGRRLVTQHRAEILELLQEFLGGS